MVPPGLMLWTIGHSNRAFDEFAALLTSNNVQLLADVRRFPGSRRYPQFGREQMELALSAIGINYVHLPELGGRRVPLPGSPNTAWRNEAFRGYADYMMSEAFREGVTRLLGFAQEKRTAIMCAEALWWQCHRGLMSDYLKAAGHSVIHILAPGKTQEHPFTSAARLINGKLSYAAPASESELPLGDAGGSATKRRRRRAVS